jgi:hypothetical protein
MHASVRYFFFVGGPPSLSQAAMIRYLLRMYRLLARRRISHTRAVPITMRSMETGDRTRTAVIPFRFNLSTTSSRPPSLFPMSFFHEPAPAKCLPSSTFLCAFWAFMNHDRSPQLCPILCVLCAVVLSAYYTLEAIAASIGVTAAVGHRRTFTAGWACGGLVVLAGGSAAVDH